MDRKRWTVLTVSALKSYRGWVSTIRPDLNLVCNETNGKNVVFLDLEPGSLNTVRGLGDLIVAVTRVKFDGHDPIEWNWDPRSDDHRTYDRNDLASIKEILDAKTMLLEFSPFMQSGMVVSKFDVRGLRKAFERYPECHLDEPPPIDRHVSFNEAAEVPPAEVRVKLPDPLPLPSRLDVQAAVTAPVVSSTEMQTTSPLSATIRSSSDPVLISGPIPTYPPLARQARIEGTIRFTAIIGIEGTVENLQLVSGHPLLVAAARDAVSQRVYHPATLNGTPYKATIEVSVPFLLTDRSRKGGGDTAPAIVRRVEPEYTKEARKAKWQGTVQLSVVIDEKGRPRDPKVIKALGLGLDQKAIEAVEKWQFHPGTRDGVPVPTKMTIDVRFELPL